MAEDIKGSPYHRHRNSDYDLETGRSSHGGSRGGFEEDDVASGPFDIFRTKSASVDRLRRWRVCGFSFLLLLFFSLPFPFCASILLIFLNVGCVKKFSELKEYF